MSLDVDLFRGVLVKEWGRIGHKAQKKESVFRPYAVVWREWDRTLEKRIKHGYNLIKKKYRHSEKRRG